MQELGADGLLVIPPFYSAPTDEEIVAHYRHIAEGVSIPIMLYNNPAITNIDMQPALIARLAELPNVAYVKESTLEVTRVRDILRLAGDRLRVFGGVLGYESFLDGARGWTAVGANVLPRIATWMRPRRCTDRWCRSSISWDRRVTSARRRRSSRTSAGPSDRRVCRGSLAPAPNLHGWNG